jgi:hypothetical protein
MVVQRADIPAPERHDFEQAIRASGKDPLSFRVELFETQLCNGGQKLRRVHVHRVDSSACAQYDATSDASSDVSGDANGGESWTGRFALHLALGVFG